MNNRSKDPAPFWQEETRCGLIASLQAPTPKTLQQLSFTHAAYVRCLGSKIYYVNKDTGEIRLLCLGGRELYHFDLAFQEYNHRLSAQELQFIEILLGHRHLTRRKRFLEQLGLFFSFIMAVGSGVTTAAAFIGLNIITGGLATVLAILIFLSGMIVNWWLYKKYVPTVLIDLFSGGRFFVDEDGQPLCLSKKILLGLSFVLALSVGMTFAILAYTSTLVLTITLTFLGVISAALPPVAALFACVTFVCLTAVMLRDIAQLLKKNEAVKECKKFFKDLVSTDPDLPRHEGKTHCAIVAERVLTIALTIIFVPLAGIGLYMTMNACVPGVKAFLLEKIPSASAALVEGFSKAISLGLAFVGQIPFTVQSICQFFSGLFEVDTAPAEQTPPRATSAQAWTAFQASQIVVNGLGNGLISMAGAQGTALRGVAFASGTANSVFAGATGVASSRRPCVFPRRSFLEQKEAQDELRFERQQQKFEKAIYDKIKCSTAAFAAVPARVSLEEKDSPKKARFFASDDLPVRYRSGS